MAKYSDIKGFTVQTLSTDTVANQFAGGGVNGGTYITTTEEWSADDFQIKTVTTS